MKVHTFGLGAITLIAMICGNASASDRPSQATLEAMGLGGIRVMDDDAAMNIRGFGYSGHSKKSSKSSANAWGSSFANVSGHGAQAGSENGYDSKGQHFAAGANIAVAGIEIVTGGGKKGGHNGGGNDAWTTGRKGGSKGSSKGGRMSSGKKGGPSGGHGGQTSVKSVKVFAGGGSIAIAD